MIQRYHNVIFLGDSITEGGNWGELFHNPRIENRGIDGDTSEGVLRRLGPILSSEPQQIFLMVGINDLWNGVSVETVVANVRQILTQCRSTTPPTSPFIQSVLPMHIAWSSSPARVVEVNAQVVALNKLLQALADEFQYSYIDLYAVFVKDGQLDLQYTGDGLHLNHKAYMKWKAAIQHLISQQS